MPTNDITSPANDQPPLARQEALEQLIADREALRQFTLNMVLDRLKADPEETLGDEHARERLHLAWQRPDERVAVQLALGSAATLAKVRVADLWAAVGVDPKVVPLHPSATPEEGWRLHEVDLEAIKDAPAHQWLWWPYMARGTIVLVDGEPGTGKSLFTMQLAAALTQGHPLPDQQGIPGAATTPQHVVVFNVEDSPSHTILPRFRRSGGATPYLHIIDGKMRGLGEGDLQPFTLADVALLDAYLTQLRHPCAMVVIDPLQAYLGAKVDMHRANETRAILTPLRAVAEKHHAVVLCVRHPAKGAAGSLAIHRGLGSIDIVGIARSALFIERFPGRDGEKKCWLMQTKNNLERIGRTQVFSKEDGLFAWVGISRLAAEDIAGGTRGPDPAAFLEACAWLEAHLTERFEPTADVEEQAEQDGINKRTLERARRALRVEARKVPQGGWTIRLTPLSIIQPMNSAHEGISDECTDVPF